MEFERDFIKDWAGLGFVAAKADLQGLALGIFFGVRVANPDNSAWVIGTALVQASCNDDVDAARAFMREQGVSESSGDPMARAFLGLFEALGKRGASAERVLRGVIADASDADAVKLAQSVLDNQVFR